MADSSPAPAGYYAAAPVATNDKHKAVPPSEPEPEPVDGQVNAPVPGYYSGPAKRGGQGSAAPKESGFFASCCACFSGGETAR